MKISLGNFSINSKPPSFSPGVCILNITSTFGNFVCWLDERDNTLKPYYHTPNDKILKIGDYLMSKFLKLKGSDFRYSKIGCTTNISYEPTKIITSDVFLLYLQSEFREETLNNIIK